MSSFDDFDRFVFVVGAPRCGTTTLSQFLKNHPSIRFPFVKEPHFFAQNDLRSVPLDDLRTCVEREYLDHFFPDAGNGRIGADASVTYLYVPEQLEPILRLWPDARFVVTLRDPIKMLPSLHKRLIYLGDETIPDFAEAWAAVPDRAEGRRIPRGTVDPRWLRYDEAARFGTYVERLFNAVGRDRCLVMLLEDVVRAPHEQYRQFMEFLGLEPQVGISLAPKRAGWSVRSRWLQRLIKRPPQLLRGYLAGELFNQRLSVNETAPGAKGILSLRKRLLEWNRFQSPEEAMSPALQRQIRQCLQGEIDHLSALIDRDLSHWLGGSSTAIADPPAGQEGGSHGGAYRAASSH